MVGDILQPTHLLFVLVVALLVLGPKRLPEVGRALGDGLRDFKAAINGESHHRHDEVADDYGREDSGSEDHEFAHAQLEATDPVLPKEPAVDEHEFAGSSASPSRPDSSAGAEAASTGEKHEFAYEGSDPAQTRDEPIG